MTEQQPSPAVFDCEIHPRMRDVNLGGHVDNVEAIRIIDEARILFLRFAPGLTGERPGLLGGAPDGVAELMGSQRVDYHAEMRFAPFQPFHVRLWISRIGRTSFSVSTELRVEAGGAPALIADSALVMWDHRTGSAWALDEELRGHLERHLAPPVALRG